MQNLKQTNDGVGYYNILEYIKIKDNKEKHIANEETSFTSKEEDSGLTDQSGLASLSASQDIPPEVSLERNLAPTPILNESMIERAPIQLFDNGPDQFQRYKLKVRLNLLNDKTNPEFIASLTQDMRNFKKYIPEPGRDEIIEVAKETRRSIKDNFGVYPWIGKFHLNNGFVPGKSSIQIEPMTFAALWFDTHHQGWSGMVQIYEWVYKFDLFDNNITAKQTKAGVVAQTLFVNPAHSKIQRPKTWAELRAGK
jgi:hypothetical protein